MDRPELRLRLLGYSLEQARAIARAVVALDARWRPSWAITEDEHADAYLLCCAAAFPALKAWASPQPIEVLDLTSLRNTHAGDPGSSEPNAGRDAEQLRDALIAKLLRLEMGMRTNLSAYRIGAAIFARHAQGGTNQGLWHLQCGNKLVAIVDFLRRRAAFDRQATSDELSQVQWIKRPDTALPPLVFHQMAIVEAMWNLSRYCPEDLMTARYENSSIWLKRLPSIAVTQISSSTMQLVALLMHNGPMTYEAISMASGLSGRMLGNTLAGLFFTGALRTNTPNRVRANPRMGPSFDTSDSVASGEGMKLGPLAASQFLVSEITNPLPQSGDSIGQLRLGLPVKRER